MSSVGGARSPRLVLLVMCVGYFLVLLDVTVVSVALPSIGADLGADVRGLQWVVDGYAIALASLLLAGGTLGDLGGHKRVVITGLIVFGVASVGCALAPGVSLLVASRVAQGAGAALLLPGTLAIIARAFPERRAQARAIGVWAAVGSAALPAGPLLGGALVQAFGWRAVFVVNVPIVAVAALVALRVVHESHDPSTRRLDVGRGGPRRDGSLRDHVRRHRGRRMACPHRGQRLPWAWWWPSRSHSCSSNAPCATRCSHSACSGGRRSRLRTPWRSR